MHDIEPYYSWRDIYIASEDELSPFFGTEYSEFEFTHAVYNHLIHPQWDSIGSSTLYAKILYAGYEAGFCIIELIGEWNDTLHNDIMYLKRNVVETLNINGINMFILIGENVMNFHSSDDSYYQEWFEEVENGWIAAINFRPHVINEFQDANLDYYMAFGGMLDVLNWRVYSPKQLYERVAMLMVRRLTG